MASQNGMLSFCFSPLGAQRAGSPSRVRLSLRTGEYGEWLLVYGVCTSKGPLWGLLLCRVGNSDTAEFCLEEHGPAVSLCTCSLPTMLYT